MGALATIALCLLAAVAGGWAALALTGARRHALEAENSRLRQRAFVLEAQGQAHERGQADVGAKLKYLADASHELRTPVAGIGGLAELLLASDLGPEQASYVQAIGIAGASLSRLVDDILDLARAGAGGMRLAAEPIELARLVEGAAELLAPLAQSKGIEIATLLRPGVPASIVGDGQRLGQVLANLIGNAVKFTEQGGVGVEVAREGDSIRFAVRDTGPGIAPGHRARIFMEYEQVAGAGAGSGLGLPIARRIVRQMGGELALVDSSNGAAFEFSVPHASPSGAREPVAGRPGIAALVVADGPFQGRYICLQLLSAGMAARCLDTVEEACRSLAANTATDVLIADAALGADALARLRAAARHAGVARTILLLSPFERHAAGASPMAGYDGWLTKPVRRQSLFERIAPPARAEAGGAGPRVLLAETTRSARWSRPGSSNGWKPRSAGRATARRRCGWRSPPSTARERRSTACSSTSGCRSSTAMPWPAPSARRRRPGDARGCASSR